MINLTKKNPTVPLIADPLGIDAAIQKLQISLSTLSWIDKVFGRAWPLPSNNGNKKTLEPMCYQGTKEYYPVLPNDALKCYSFFRVSGPRTTVDYQANMNTGGNYIFKDPVDLIVWGNLHLIDPTRDFIRIPLQTDRAPEHIEQFTISVEPAGGSATAAMLVLAWERRRMRVTLASH